MIYDNVVLVIFMRNITIFIIIFLFFILTVFKISSFKKEDLRVEDKKNEIRGIFISYIDYKGKFVDDNKAKEEIDKMITNVEKEKFNLIIIQVRSFSDSLYESEIFPKNVEVKCNFDVLEYFIEESHKRNILVYAWVNPYRISTNVDPSKIDESNPAYKWMDTNNVKVVPGKGIYYNPASSDVRELITKGVLEIVFKYKIDGVCFDDYFYPDNSIDTVEYEEYLKGHPGISLTDFHLLQVNELISGVYKGIKEIKKDVLFGISPDGNIDNNYSIHGADVKTWVTHKGYVDFIMPQVYYGFKNEARPYIETIRQWNKLITIDSISLIPALALYKAGSVDEYAKAGKMEWIEDNDILKKQVTIGRNLTHYKGFAIFRYDYMFNEATDSTSVIKEIENLKKIID